MFALFNSVEENVYRLQASSLHSMYTSALLSTQSPNKMQEIVCMAPTHLQQLLNRTQQLLPGLSRLLSICSCSRCWSLPALYRPGCRHTLPSTTHTETQPTFDLDRYRRRKQRSGIPAEAECTFSRALMCLRKEFSKWGRMHCTSQLSPVHLSIATVWVCDCVCEPQAAL